MRIPLLLLVVDLCAPLFTANTAKHLAESTKLGGYVSVFFAKVSALLLWICMRSFFYRKIAKYSAESAKLGG